MKNIYSKNSVIHWMAAHFYITLFSILQQIHCAHGFLAHAAGDILCFPNCMITEHWQGPQDLQRACYLFAH